MPERQRGRASVASRGVNVEKALIHGAQPRDTLSSHVHETHPSGLDTLSSHVHETHPSGLRPPPLV